ALDEDLGVLEAGGQRGRFVAGALVGFVTRLPERDRFVVERFAAEERGVERGGALRIAAGVRGVAQVRLDVRRAAEAEPGTREVARADQQRAPGGVREQQAFRVQRAVERPVLAGEIRFGDAVEARGEAVAGGRGGLQ